jgi:very-short-patch-repair endonuclease
MDQEHLHSKPELKYVRRHLRREQTPAERFLWQKLRNRQLYGRKFKRQYSIGRYVVDFYCAEERLAVELDGSVHDRSSRIYDEERAQFLEAEGIRIVRFENREVFERLETVLEAIAYHFGTSS